MNLSDWREPNCKIRLGGKFSESTDISGLLEFSQKVKRISFTRRKLEKIKRRELIEKKKTKAMLLVADFFNGKECNYGFNKEVNLMGALDTNQKINARHQLATVMTN